MRRTERARGFTLVELMVTVAILITLSVVAGGAYRRYLDNARKTEVLAMFAEVRAKEEAYRAEFSVYCSTSANDTTFFPALGANEPKAKVWTPTPAEWRALNLAPGKAMLYCGYAVMGGAANVMPAGSYGAAAFGNVAPTQPWWYAVGTCDNDGAPGKNAIFVTTSDKDTVYEQDIHN
jgi:prepilin-type N-terminal cleavage/methylation domain-containing protein